MLIDSDVLGRLKSDGNKRMTKIVWNFSGADSHILTDIRGRGGDDDEVVIEHAFPSCLSCIETDIQLENPDTHRGMRLTALWDTGSTNSCVANAVADLLELNGGRDADVVTQADGVISCPVVIGNMRIEDMLFERKSISVPLVGGRNPSVIIGMDVIGMGDFSIARKGAMSVFRFSIKKSCLQP